MSSGIAGSFVWPLLPLGGSLTLVSAAEGHPPQLHIDQKKLPEQWRRQQPNQRCGRNENLVQLAVTNGQPLFIPTFPSGRGLGHFTEHQLLHQKGGVPTSSSDWPWHGMFSLSCWMRTHLGKEGEYQVTDTQHTCSLLWGVGLLNSKCVLGMMLYDYGNGTELDLPTKGWCPI